MAEQKLGGREDSDGDWVALALERCVSKKTYTAVRDDYVGKPDAAVRVTQAFGIPCVAPERITASFGEGSLGMSLREGDGAYGTVFVRAFSTAADGTPGQAEKLGTIRRGDVVSALGGTRVVRKAFEDVIGIIRSAPRPLEIEFERFPRRLVPDFSGSWVISSKRSDKLEPLLKLLGLPWMTRKAAGSIKQSLIIRQTVETFSTTYKSVMGSTTDELAFGQETVIVASDQRPQKVTLEWDIDSAALVTTTVVSLNRGWLYTTYRLAGTPAVATADDDDDDEVAPGGRMLSVQLKMSHRNGKTVVVNRVYKEKKKRRKGAGK